MHSIKISNSHQIDSHTSVKSSVAQDPAQVLIATCMHYEVYKNQKDITTLFDCLDFIKKYQQEDGSFIYEVRDTKQHQPLNAEELNGRVIWSLGYLLDKKSILPEDLITQAELLLLQAIPSVAKIDSSRGIAFAIKGLYLYFVDLQSSAISDLINTLADKLATRYMHKASFSWCWFECDLTHTNSILPEALLYAYLISFNPLYKKIALNSFDFLHTQKFNEIATASTNEPLRINEHPIDAACMIMSLSAFYDVFKDEAYIDQMEMAFARFLKSDDVKAEHGVCYIMAWLTMKKYFNTDSSPEIHTYTKTELVERFAKVSIFLALALFTLTKLFGGQSTSVRETNSIGEI